MLGARADGVSADDTDLILQSDQSVACVNSRLAWSFEWAWMIYAVSVGYRVNTYNTTVQCMLRYCVPDALRTVYGTVVYSAEQQEAHACVLGSGTCMRMNHESRRAG